MEAETEKKDNETTDPMLEQLVCQWRKDVEEFDAQVLPPPIHYEHMYIFTQALGLTC